MRKAAIWLLAILALFTSSLAGAQTPQKAILIFKFPVPEGDALKGAMRSTTLAFKEAIIQAGATDVLIFDPESPTAKRALKEHSLPASVAEIKIPMTDAMKAARVLGAGFVFSGDLDDAGNQIHVLMGDAQSSEITTIGTIDLKNATLDTLTKSAQELGKQAWGRVNALVDQAPQDTQKKAKAIADVIATAQRYLDADDPEGAAEELNDAIRKAPKDPEVHLAVGRFYLSQGKLANAIVELRTAVNLDPTQIVYRLWLSDAYIQKQMFSEAESEVKRGIALNSEEPRLYAQLAKIYYQQGALDDAIVQLNRSLDRNRKDPDVYTLLGDVYLRKGRTSQAIAAYVETAKLAPTNPQIHQRLAMAYASTGMLSESLASSILALRNTQCTDEERYVAAMKLVDDHIRGLLAKYDADQRMYQNGAMGTGDFSDSCQTLSSRANALLKFMDEFAPPTVFKQFHEQRSLGLSLLSQAAASQLAALSTGNTEHSEEAHLLMLQARRELAQTPVKAPAAKP